jgi:hypothetical protein
LTLEADLIYVYEDINEAIVSKHVNGFR